MQRSIDWYRGTLRLRDLEAGSACVAEWTADYECPPADADHWAAGGPQRSRHGWSSLDRYIAA